MEDGAQRRASILATPSSCPRLRNVYGSRERDLHLSREVALASDAKPSARTRTQLVSCCLSNPSRQEPSRHLAMEEFSSMSCAAIRPRLRDCPAVRCIATSCAGLRLRNDTAHKDQAIHCCLQSRLWPLAVGQQAMNSSSWRLRKDLPGEAGRMSAEVGQQTKVFLLRVSRNCRKDGCRLHRLNAGQHELRTMLPPLAATQSAKRCHSSSCFLAPACRN